MKFLDWLAGWTESVANIYHKYEIGLETQRIHKKPSYHSETDENCLLRHLKDQKIPWIGHPYRESVAKINLQFFSNVDR
jgi:hypothetical protein